MSVILVTRSARKLLGFSLNRGDFYFKTLRRRVQSDNLTNGKKLFIRRVDKELNLNK